MEYYVIGPDGSRFGPGDIPTLRQWVSESRITPQTSLEETLTGQRFLAQQVPGLFQSFEAPPSMMPPGQPPYGEQIAGYTRPAMYGYTGGSKELTTSFVWTALGLALCPIICPIIGLSYANKAKMLGNPSAQGARIFAIVVLALQGFGVVIELLIFLYLIASGQPPPF